METVEATKLTIYVGDMTRHRRRSSYRQVVRLLLGRSVGSRSALARMMRRSHPPDNTRVLRILGVANKCCGLSRKNECVCNATVGVVASSYIRERWFGVRGQGLQ